MAKPPESTKTSLRQRLAARAAERWPQLAGIDVRWHGQFAYVSGQLPDGTSLPLMPAPLRRLSIYLGIRDLPGQPRRLREIHPAQRLASRHPTGSPRLRLRPLPRRPHRLAHPAPPTN